MPSYLQLVDEVSETQLKEAYKVNRRDMYILNLESLVLYYWNARCPNTPSSSTDRVNFIINDLDSDIQKLLDKPHNRTSCMSFKNIFEYNLTSSIKNHQFYFCKTSILFL